MSDECVIQAFPDITGLGIRAIVYVASSLQVLAVVCRSKRLASALVPAHLFLTFSLLLNAAIQTAQKKLSLLDAIVVTYYFFLTSGGVLRPLVNNGSREDRVVLWNLLLTAFGACFGGWWIFLMRNVENFGAQPECNDKTIIVILWISIRATVPWLRILSFVLAGIILFAVGLVIVVVCMFTDIWKSGRSVEKWRCDPSICLRICDFLTYVVPNAFLISWIELTIHRNNIGPGANEWSLGQTMAAMFYVFSFVSFLLSLAQPDYDVSMA